MVQQNIQSIDEACKNGLGKTLHSISSSKEKFYSIKFFCDHVFAKQVILKEKSALLVYSITICIN